MGSLDFERPAEPIFDGDAVLSPGSLRIGRWLQTLVLKTLEVVGERNAAFVVAFETGAMEPLVRPPELPRIEASVGNRARR